MKKIVVQVSPNGVGPSWWSQKRRPLESPACHVIDYSWHTVTATGGFTSGADWSEAVGTDEELAERVDTWFEVHEEDPWPWRFRVLVATADS